MTMCRRLIAVVAMVMVAGCARDQGSTAPTTGVPGSATSVRPTLADLPPAVGNAFTRDHPNAGITAITPGNAETGAPLYRITYIDNRTPGSETYFIDGTKLPASSTAVPAGTPLPPSDSGAGR